MNTKNNRRFHETDLKIQEVMLSIMNKHDFEDITVRAICSKAEINRSTFYLHYQDIYDLMDKMEYEMSKGIQAGYEGFAIDFADGDIFNPRYLRVFLEHVYSHRQFYKVCLKNRKTFPIKRGFDSLWNLIMKPRFEKAGVHSEDEMMLYFVYTQGGMTTLLRHWLDDGCRETPETISIIMSKCFPDVLRSPAFLKKNANPASTN